MNSLPAITNHLRGEVERHPYPLLFVTVSGAHLYGLPSPDSDFDLRGVHVLPVRELVGLDPGRVTVESTTTEGGVELDVVMHDVKEFFTLLVRKNGYVLEQLYSPLVVVGSAEHEELKAVAGASRGGRISAFTPAPAAPSPAGA